jgi:hypothetical protein
MADSDESGRDSMSGQLLSSIFLPCEVTFSSVKLPFINLNFFCALGNSLSFSYVMYVMPPEILSVLKYTSIICMFSFRLFYILLLVFLIVSNTRVILKKKTPTYMIPIFVMSLSAPIKQERGEG